MTKTWPDIYSNVHFTVRTEAWRQDYPHQVEFPFITEIKEDVHRLVCLSVLEQVKIPVYWNVKGEVRHGTRTI